jgi:hypothetical protein
MFNVLHLGKVVKLDFIVRKDTPYRRREFERRKRVQMPGFEANPGPSCSCGMSARCLRRAPMKPIFAVMPKNCRTLRFIPDLR